MSDEAARPSGRRRAAMGTFVGSSLATLIAAVQALALTPLVMSQTSRNLFGAWAGSGDLLLWMLIFDFGLPNLMIQRIGAAHVKQDYTTVGRYFATGLLTMSVLVCALALLVIAIAQILPAWSNVIGKDAEI